MQMKSNSAIWSDFALVTSSIVLAFLMISKHESEKKVPFYMAATLVVMGSCFFVKITNLFNKLLLCTKIGLNFIQRFNLSLSDCLDISNKLVSAIQSILCCVFGFFLCQYACGRNFLTTTHIFSESYAWFGTAYFIYDIFSMYKVYNARLLDKLNLKVIKWPAQEDLLTMIPTLETGELSWFRSKIVDNEKIPSFWQFVKKSKMMVFHHGFIGGYGLIVISAYRGGLGDCVIGFVYLMEVSTPFVSFRAILSILNLKKSKLFILNGLAMIISFTIFRIFMLPALLYYYSTVVNLSFMQAVMKLPLCCKLSIVAMFLPQYYWYNLMIRAAMKMFKPQKHAKEINHNGKED